MDVFRLCDGEEARPSSYLRWGCHPLKWKTILSIQEPHSAVLDRDHAKLYDLLIQELEEFAVFLVNLNGRITSWNPGVERFLGYVEAEFVGRPVSDIFTPEDRAARVPEREMENARDTGRAADMRWHLRNDQSRVFVEGVFIAIRDEAGVLVGFAKMARAIHQRYVAGSILSTILEGTDDAIYAIDKEGRYTFANAQAARLWDRSIEQLIGHKQEDVLSPSGAAELRATNESVMDGAHPRLIEEDLPRTTKQGERTILTTKAPWRDSKGRTIGLVAIAKDITTRKALQGERERLLREVRRANEELSAFPHVVAHDLGAPLRAVKLHTELLAEHMQDRLDDAARQMMTFVKEGAEHMERLIESLLRYAESGEGLDLRRVNVNTVLDQLVRTLEPLIQQSKTTITRDTLPSVVEADPVRLQQVFQNLVVNAIKYRGIDSPRIHVSGEISGEEYRFAVADNGIGIARRHFERIFMPLKRLHGEEIPGSGIGLALSRRIIELHGGRIWVESHVGKGSTFVFTLPMMRQKPEQP